MFGIKKKSIDDMTTEEIEKYLSERKSSEESDQSLKDRVDESVAEQEKADGDKDKQSAKDRVDEALGEDEKAYEEDEKETKSEEKQEEAEEVEETDSANEWQRKIEAELADLKAQIAAFVKQPKEVDKDVSDKLSELEKKYN